MFIASLKWLTNISYKVSADLKMAAQNRPFSRTLWQNSEKLHISAHFSIDQLLILSKSAKHHISRQFLGY